MTHHRLAAGLYQLVRIILNEDEVGCSVFEYDKPSSLFGQFDDEQISADARGLDVALERARQRATDFETPRRGACCGKPARSVSRTFAVMRATGDVQACGGGGSPLTWVTSFSEPRAIKKWGADDRRGPARRDRTSGRPRHHRAAG